MKIFEIVCFSPNLERAKGPVVNLVLKLQDVVPQVKFQDPGHRRPRCEPHVRITLVLGRSSAAASSALWPRGGNLVSLVVVIRVLLVLVQLRDWTLSDQLLQRVLGLLQALAELLLPNAPGGEASNQGLHVLRV